MQPVTPRTEGLTAVLILAGGQASRLPGKLALDAGGMPLLERVYRNVRSAGPTYVAAAGGFAPQLDAALDCPVLVDRWAYRGPLAALYSALPHLSEPRVFVVAGDAPFVDAAVAAELAQHWEAQAQAVVPVNRHGILEPLCALYDRAALMEAARAVVQEGSGGVAAAVERLRAKRVRISNERVFTNVNTPADYALLKV